MSGPGGLSAPWGVWSGGCLLQGGVSGPRGGCLLRGVSASEGVSAPGGSASRGGVCLVLGGVSFRGGLLPGGVCSGGCLPLGVSARGGVVSQHALRQTPPCEQNDKLE